MNKLWALFLKKKKRIEDKNLTSGLEGGSRWKEIRLKGYNKSLEALGP